MFKKILLLLPCLLYILLLTSCKTHNMGAYIVQIDTVSDIKTLSSTAQKKSASGVIIGNNTILTVAHGVGNTKSHYTVNNHIPATLEKKYSKTDIALLTISENSIQLPNLTVGIPKNGEIVFSYSQLGKKSGSITQVGEQEFFVDIPFQAGESGGGIFNEKKELIGIIGAYDFEKNRGVGYTIKKE